MTIMRFIEDPFLEHFYSYFKLLFWKESVFDLFEQKYIFTFKSRIGIGTTFSTPFGKYIVIYFHNDNATEVNTDMREEMGAVFVMFYGMIWVVPFLALQFFSRISWVGKGNSHFIVVSEFEIDLE